VLHRSIVPEILDTLAADHPDAVRSRRDLRWLDHFLGGSRWVERTLRKNLPGSGPRIVELGAGEGLLCERVARAFPSAIVTGMDLLPRPLRLSKPIQWVSGDFFQAEEITQADIVIGNLILHHFENSALENLAARFESARLLVFSEPWRDRAPLYFSRWAGPLVGRVTQHDMPASIRAGFREGELPAALGLNPRDWNIAESSRWRGVLRMIAWRT